MFASYLLELIELINKLNILITIQSKKQKTNALPKTTGNNLRSQPMIIYQMSPPMPPMYNSYQHGYYSTKHHYNLNIKKGDFLMKFGDSFLKYETNFIDNGYTVDLLGQLKNIGVDLAGHRIKILVELGIKIPN
ncbi:hypothetical protein GLOIN_2v1768424 [Rhizophagus irregularis DAOM 181602=DAOM 197198]|uniref:SAM domain-containing protein n=1 Tax=Rhizophagus irregularis (strain DAOM 181602 / DAOM 197198 / MUCL 43194) TaxID=747089 RepID=A0A2P4QH49_RHIID|nr:hypothetical protein GLOIN_2v1768424 [Rhizophagus irregularis DAOM 181602=DAOM 197198]POG76957.1 hypothetical protein GLOIN_2v1768424 [Rhizophagus irregularis DAOM 181602=DAOM 197198]|eukprot:XP_025183823.1 hypothetical protein GLOIN_2v1768424 [Rhizophagus irregularis DAOM 181602=DAOM 197198]